MFGFNKKKRLIEGPVDMNGRLDELRLDHELPIAVYSYLHGEGVRHSSWTPFCEYSPEWQAIHVGPEVASCALRHRHE